MTEWLIEQIKDPAVIEEFVADPDIMKNLQRVADAIEENTKGSPGQTTEQIRGDGDSKDMKNTKNWTYKAVHEKGGQSPKRD